MPDASADVTGSNTYIEAEIVDRLKKVEDEFDADIITCIHPIGSPFDDIIRQHVDDLKDKKKNLLVILETDGGSIETTERIATVFRHNYPDGEVSFVIPNCAMSAGTILAMSGDRILMDYYSIIGPIDPQVKSSDGRSVPGLGYVEKFNQFVRKSKSSSLTSAELAFLLDKFDPATLHWLEQAREHGVDLLKEWLVKYKFKNWTKTKTRGRLVTPEMKERRAKDIAGKLNNTKLWRSHGRGISIRVASEILQLEIEDFGSDPNLVEFNNRLCSYYRMLKDYMMRRNWDYVIETRDGRFAY